MNVNAKTARILFAGAAMALAFAPAAAAQDDCEASSADEANCSDVAGVAVEPSNPDTAAPSTDTNATVNTTTAAATLPVTGSETTALALSGAALVAGGGALVMWRRQASPATQKA